MGDVSGSDDPDDAEALREDWEAYRRDTGGSGPRPPFAEWRIRHRAEVAQALRQMEEAEPWPGHLLVVCGIEREARLVAPFTEAVLTGGGDAAGLARGLEWIRAKEPAAAALSFGLAGGLDPALAVGDLVCARAVWDGARDIPTDPAWTDRLAEATGARIVERVMGQDAVAADAPTKARLRAATGAATVDMESHVLARWTVAGDPDAEEDAGAATPIPLAVLRAVSDAADTAIPSSALAGFGGEKPKVGAVLRRLAVRPGELPALVGTARNVDRALRRLADAVDALGEDLGFPR